MASSGTAADQVLTYTFPVPEYSTSKDGVTVVAVPGLKNGGKVGDPSLPVLPVRIAVPQGRAIASVTVTPGASTLLATGLTLDHVQKYVRASRKPAPFVPTARNEAVYSSSDPFPAKPESTWTTAWKNGVAFCELTLCPIVYLPATGEVRYFSEITVKVNLQSSAGAVRGGAARPAAPAGVTSFKTQDRAADVLPLVDNPDVVAAYAPAAGAKSLSAATLDGELDPFVAEPALPCDPTNSFVHVIITSDMLRPAFVGLAQYRRSTGVASTVVTVEAIREAYGASADDDQTAIRNFIKDAYNTWGTAFVVLGGDIAHVPARGLYGSVGEDVDELPSDLYYQCLDGDFDANGNGVYGEEDDDVDYYAEVAIGRVSAESVDEAANWIAKMKKYDVDCAVGEGYTRGSMYVGEYVGPYDNTYAKPLLEVIRIGSKAAGGRLSTYGFEDAPDLFDVDREVMVYEQDQDWDAGTLVTALNNDATAIVNHMGHSDYNYNMKLSNTDVDGLQNKNPFFVYSQGCIAGAFDKDCIAEHFTTSTKFGAFAGVWNSRYGWYSYNSQGIASVEGPSEVYHRRFWDVIFRYKLHAMGTANMLSHEFNAPQARNDECLRWCYYETNLFGDPMQNISGDGSSLTFDREAYKSSAVATITYKGVTDEESVGVVFSAVRKTYDPATFEEAGSEDLEIVSPTEMTLFFAGMSDGCSLFTNSVALSDFVLNADPASLTHDDVLVVAMADGSFGQDTAYIDDVAPAFRDVVLRNPDEGLVSSSWVTYSPDKSNPAAEVFTDEETLCEFYLDRVVPLVSPFVVKDDEDEGYVTEHAAQVADLECALYYVRILAADKAGNTNVWCSTAVSDSIYSGDVDEHGKIIVAARTLRAAYDMEKDASSWTTTPESCWELGTPVYGPENASRCYGTELAGRYPDGVNTALISPTITLGACPTIAFRQWYDIERTPEGYGNLDKADYGIVEILMTGADDSYATPGVIDGAWHNVLPYARVYKGDIVQGQSEGWEEVRILLPEEYDGKTVRVRFRFVSDTFTAGLDNPAGWYVDNVRFYDVAEGGIALTVAEIDDSEGGNGDGAVQPGETFKVKFASCNISYDTITIPDGCGTIALSASGSSSGKATLVGASPAAISYPPLTPGTLTPANETFEISVDPTIPFGASITVVQTLVDQDGDRFEAYVTIPVSNPSGISGVVLQPTGEPVVNAEVSINASEGDYSFTTGEDGSFNLTGLSSNRHLRVVATYGYATTNAVVVTPKDGLEMILPLAEIGVDPTDIKETMSSIDEDIVVSFCISNFFNLASLDGNVGPSCNLDYEISELIDAQGSALDWIELLSPATGSIEPNGTAVIELKLKAQGVDASLPHNAALRIRSNAWNEEEVAVMVSLEIERNLYLEADGLSAVEFDPVQAEALGLAPGDGDGLLESGESGEIRFALFNPDENEVVNNFSGEIECVSGNATVADGYVYWGEIYPQHSTECLFPVTVTIDAAPGEVIVFHLTGEVSFGEDGSTFQDDLYFEYTNLTYNAVAGSFTTLNLVPADPPGATNPVVNAVVTLTGENGGVLEGEPTAADGSFVVNGLVPGEKYWVSFATSKSDRETVPPFAFLITADENLDDGTPNGFAFTNNIVGTTYGATNPVPHLRLMSVEVTDTDGDGKIDFGEEFAIAVEVMNDGRLATDLDTNMVAVLTLPEFEHDACMELVDAIDDESVGVIATDESVVFSGFRARAFDYGAANPGDFQRFCLEVYENTGTEEAKRWYFDFSLAIDPSYCISGTVSTTVPGGTVKGTQIKAESADGAFASVITLIDNAESAEYKFTGLDAGEYTVSVIAVPAGSECEEPSVLVQEITSEDWTDADFTLSAWSVSIDGDPEYFDAEDGSVNIEINEGESLSVPLTITNDGTVDAEVVLAITYDRKDSEVLSMDQIKDSIAAAKAAANAKLGNDWTKLDPREFNAGELEVTFKPGTTVAARDAYLNRHGFVATYHFTTIPASIAVPAAQALGASRAVAALKNPASFKASPEDDVMVSIQPSAVCHLVDAVELPPEDPLYAEQWALNNTRQNGGTLGADIGAEAAWSYLQSTGSKKIHVAVTDTGIYYAHPDLIGNWTGLGWNYVYNTSSVDDANGHGTHVAGIIGAVGNNGIGVSGVNWSVGLVSSRICAPSLAGEAWASNAQVARAFEESYTLFGCSVNNNSWGGPIYSQLMYDMIERSKEWGMLYVISAGNDADDIDVVPTYPACYSQWLDNVIVVAAADSDDNMAYFSSYSPKLVQLAAPGYDILSTYLDLSKGTAALDGAAKAAGEGNYASLSGTSMAAPFVSGAAALLKSISPTASYKVIRDALLNGVRKDDGLADFVSTSGHLDIGNSVRLLGNMWIRCATEDKSIVLTTNVTVAAGSSVDVDFLINDPAALMAGTYTASIELSGGISSRVIPVTLDVISAPVPAVESVEVVDEQNPDGKASFGEEATLSVILKNIGTCEFEDLSAKLVASNGTVIDGEVDFGYLPGNDTTDPALAFRVSFPASGDSAEFTLEVYEAGELVAELPVSIELFNGSVVKVTVTDAGAPVADAIVEVIGGSAARTVTDASGVAYVAVPVSESASALTLRVFTDNAVRHSAPLDASAKEVNVALKHAALTCADGDEINVTITEGMAATAEIALSATADAGSVAGTVGLAKRARIAIIDDSTNATFVASAIKAMGFDVDYYGDNYAVVRYVNPATEMSEIEYMVRYSWDDALIFDYDAVIAIVSGTTGKGRLLIAEEAQAYRDYIARGGKVIFAGNAPLSRPDNLDLAEMLGLAEDACVPVEVPESYARVAEDGLGAPFAQIASGDAFPVCSGSYDVVNEAVSLSGSASAEMDVAGLAKIYMSELSDRGGQAVLWNGSAEDFATDGTALDILRGYFYSEFIASADLGWLTTASSDFTVNSGASSTITLDVNPQRSLGVGEYSAVVCLAADTDGSVCQSVVVNVKVMPPVVRAHNLSGNVTDWGNRYLLGDGGAASCMFQLIYAGADGEIGEPGEDGMPTGDDVILAASGTGLNFSFFGAGEDMTANVGKFDVNFNLEFEGFEPGIPGVKLYVRAWDSPSAASSIAYGDSALFEVTYENGRPAAIDFGSWTVGSARDNLGDSNGDSIPDAWGFEYRPDLDPRAPFDSLDTAFTMPASNSFATAIAAANYNADGNPARVFVTEKFIVVLEQFTHRIAVHNREYPYDVVNYYGATTRNGAASNHTVETYDFSNADGAFNQPFGMALDAFSSGITRFAVADKNNDRVQLFSLDETTGEITFLAKYGTRTPEADIGNSADTATMHAPLAVAFMKGGDLIVSDSDNFRVIRLRTTGNALVYKTRYDFTTQSRIFGLCYDKDSAEGFWVVDGGREKQCVAFYHTASWSQKPVVSFGEQDSKDFVSPRDVQVWTVGSRKRLVVADYSGSRVRVLEPVAGSRGSYVDLTVALDAGSFSDATLQPYEKFYLPNGVFPISDSNLVYVADYGHNMIKWFSVSFDLDEDGMDDIWEDLHGLDSTIDDSLDDLDGDGLLNIGEYRSNCDPDNVDTDGDGVGDLAEMNNLRDPLDSNEPEWTPAEIVSVTVSDANGAESDEFLVTSNVVIKVEFDREVTGDSRIIICNEEGDCLVKAPMTVEGTTASYVYVATQSAIGVVDVSFVFADCDPPSADYDELFTVIAPTFVSAETFDENGDEASEFYVGSNVTVKVSFDRALSDTAASGSYSLYNAGNEILASGPLSVEGDEMSFDYKATLAAAGDVTAVFTFVNASPATCTETALFTVIVPEDPVPPPEPETEEIRWSITSIKFVTDGAPSLRLTWDYPTTVADGTECKFRVERAATLVNPEWAPVGELPATDASGCVFDVDLTQFEDVSANFFRLWWINSPKE